MTQTEKKNMMKKTVAMKTGLRVGQIPSCSDLVAETKQEIAGVLDWYIPGCYNQNSDACLVGAAKLQQASARSIDDM